MSRQRLPLNPAGERLEALLRQRIVYLDGAMGTMIQQLKLQEADYRGDRFKDHPGQLKGNNDLLVITKPSVVRDIHRAYLDAGADILETNTFNGTSIAKRAALRTSVSKTVSQRRRSAPASIRASTCSR